MLETAVDKFGNRLKGAPGFDFGHNILRERLDLGGS